MRKFNYFRIDGSTPQPAREQSVLYPILFSPSLLSAYINYNRFKSLTAILMPFVFF
jgi:hypothetical protein